MSERLRNLAIASTVGVAAIGLSTSAFSRRSRNKILERDGHKCTECGSTEHLEAAHISHKRDKNYDNPDNGRTLCTEDHMIDHIERHGRNGLSKRANAWAVDTISKRLP